MPSVRLAYRHRPDFHSGDGWFTVVSQGLLLEGRVRNSCCIENQGRSPLYHITSEVCVVWNRTNLRLLLYSQKTKGEPGSRRCCESGLVKCRQPHGVQIRRERR